MPPAERMTLRRSILSFGSAGTSLILPETMSTPIMTIVSAKKT